ncbi:MAG: 4Fe-4S binding protein [Deltaproteobacteria bacterium]|nr:4Fe-4S binding protein [Deltaproteobacteria bacterium]
MKGVGGAFFVAVGAFSFIAQALLFREFAVLYQGSELSIGLFIASWLAWIAVGAGLGRPLVRRLSPGGPAAPRDRVVSVLSVLGVLYALAPMAQLWALRSLRGWLSVPAWEVLPLDSLLVYASLANAPVSFLTGLLFSVGSAARGRAQEGDVAGNYVAEGLGSFAGGVTVTVLVTRGVAVMTLFISAAIILLGTLVVVALRARRRVAALVLTGAVAAGLVVAFSGLGRRLSDVAEGRRWASVVPGATLLLAKDTPYQHLAIGRLGPSTLVVRDGELVASFPDEPGYAFDAAMIATQRPRARRVLLIGDVATGLLRHLLAYGSASVVYLDGDAEATRVLRPFLLPADRRALDDPRVDRRIGDLRALTRRLDPQAPFDLIVILGEKLDTRAENRLHTIAFYRGLRQVLRPGGVLITQLRVAENVATHETATLASSILRTLGAEFSRVRITPGRRAWVVAGGASSSLSVDPRELARRYAKANLAYRYFPAATLARAFSASRAETVRQRYLRAPAAVNRDAHPVATFYALLRHARVMNSRLGRLLGALHPLGFWVFFLPLLTFTLLRAHALVARLAAGRDAGRDAVRQGNARLVLIVAGAVGMALQVLLLQAFQSRQGVLFVDLGLVAGLAMLGLGVGGVAILRGVMPRGGVARRRVAVAIFLAGGLVVAMLPWLLSLVDVGGAQERWLFFVLFFVAGALGGAAVPLAEARLSEASTSRGAFGADVAPASVPASAGVVAADLAIADHAGGAIAALLMGALIVPLCGLSEARWLLLFSLASLALFLSLERWRPQGALGRWVAQRARARSFAFAGSWPRILIGIAIVAVGFGALLTACLDSFHRRLSPLALRALTRGQRFVEGTSPFIHYRVDPSPRPRAAVATSAAVAPDIRGYGGKLNVFVGVDDRGRLRRPALLQSHETPQYLRGLGSWLDTLKGRDISRPLCPRTRTDERPLSPDDVDVLSGATVTSEAVIAAINRTGGRLSRDILGRPSSADRGTAPSRWRGTIFGASAVYVLLALLLTLFVARWGGSTTRLIFLALNLLVAGVLFNVQLSLHDLAALLQLSFPTEVFRALLLLGVLLLALFFGPLYCAHLCPFGAAQELLSRLGLRRRLAPRVDHRARGLKYVLLTLVIIALTVGAGARLLALDPLTWHFGSRVAGWAFVVLGLIFAFSLVVYRPWCRYLCPVGAALHLANKLRLGASWQRTRRYDRCDLGVLGPRDVDCLQCDRCVVASSPAPRDDAMDDAMDDAISPSPRPLATWTLVTWFFALAVAFALASGSLQGAADRATSKGLGRGRPRRVDSEALLRQIQSGHLARHRALYWHVRGQGPASAPARRVPLGGASGVTPMPLHGPRVLR